MKFNLNADWTTYPIVAFDTETSGPYPLEADVVELGAVKWHNGQIIDRFQMLLKPRVPMTEENMRIHGIRNEMVENTPPLEQVILSFCEFIDGSLLLAHHAPFDLGFIAPAIEQAGLKFPENELFCSSLISRALLHTTNHKLQTLVKELSLEGGDAHRAYDDAYACLQVFFKSIEKLQGQVTLNRLRQIQVKNLKWDNFKLFSLDDLRLKSLIKAIQNKKSISIVYEGGQSKSKPRLITPKGIVRNPDGDYVHAICEIDQTRKRFYLNKILDYEI